MLNDHKSRFPISLPNAHSKINAYMDELEALRQHRLLHQSLAQTSGVDATARKL